MALLKGPGPIRTTVIGGFPCVNTPFSDGGSIAVTSNPFEKVFQTYKETHEKLGPKKLERGFQIAVREVIDAQMSAGVNVITDGEVTRDNYVHYQCRHINNISFDVLTEGWTRAKRALRKLPTVVGPVSAGEPFLVKDWERAQSMTSHPVKATLPGPHCILDTITDNYYNDRKKLCQDLAKCVNVEVLRLVEAGVKHIQIDEPAFSREPRECIEFGVDCLNRAVEGVPSDVHVQCHVCYGYPDETYDDQVVETESSFKRADRNAYEEIAPYMNEANVDSIALEDGHWHHDLEFLKYYTKKQLCWGAVAIARKKVESVGEIKARLREVAEVFPPERLLVAPDCGLGMLSVQSATQKLTNMCIAVSEINYELNVGKKSKL